MNVSEAKKKKAQLELDVFGLLKKYEEETELEVAAVLVQREDISQMGENPKSLLSSLEIIVGVDIPASPKGGMQI